MLVIDLRSAIPLNDQITAGLRLAIARGIVETGDELPPVRQLAEDLNVNFNTVARAYRNLESSGLIKTSRGRGTHVVSQVESGNTTQVEKSILAAVVDARLSGWSRAKAKEQINAAIDAVWRGPIKGAKK